MEASQGLEEKYSATRARANGGGQIEIIDDQPLHREMLIGLLEPVAEEFAWKCKAVGSTSEAKEDFYDAKNIYIVITDLHTCAILGGQPDAQHGLEFIRFVRERYDNVHVYPHTRSVGEEWQRKFAALGVRKTFPKFPGMQHEYPELVKWIRKSIALFTWKNWEELCKQTYREKLSELQDKYRNMFVAISGSDVIDFSEDLDELLDKYSMNGSRRVMTFHVPSGEESEERGSLVSGKPFLL